MTTHNCVLVHKKRYEYTKPNQTKPEFDLAFIFTTDQIHGEGFEGQVTR